MIPVLSRDQVRAFDRACDRRLPRAERGPHGERGARRGRRDRAALARPARRGGEDRARLRHRQQRRRRLRRCAPPRHPRRDGGGVPRRPCVEAFGGRSGPLRGDDRARLVAREASARPRRRFVRRSPRLCSSWTPSSAPGSRGLSKGLTRQLLEAVQQAGRPIVALDIPSGLDADTGMPLGIAVHADLTITFGAHKLGLLTPSGSRFAGEVVRRRHRRPCESHRARRSLGWAPREAGHRAASSRPRSKSSAQERRRARRGLRRLGRAPRRRCDVRARGASCGGRARDHRDVAGSGRCARRTRRRGDDGAARAGRSREERRRRARAREGGRHGAGFREGRGRSHGGALHLVEVGRAERRRRGRARDVRGRPGGVRVVEGRRRAHAAPRRARARSSGHRAKRKSRPTASPRWRPASNAPGRSRSSRGPTRSSGRPTSGRSSMRRGRARSRPPDRAMSCPERSPRSPATSTLSRLPSPESTSTALAAEAWTRRRGDRGLLAHEIADEYPRVIADLAASSVAATEARSTR